MPRLGIDLDGTTQQLASAIEAEVQHRISPYNGHTNKGEWSATTPYTTDHWVSYAGFDWLTVGASTNVIPGSNSTKWVRIGLSHYPGYRNRGVWSGVVTYAANDWVNYNGNDWYAVATSLNITPGSNFTKWMLLSDDAAPEWDTLHPWIPGPPQAPSTTLFVDNVEQGAVYDIRVRYRLVDGGVTSWRYRYNSTVVGKDVEPANVTGFTAICYGFGIVGLVWYANLEPDIDHYELRMGGTNWATSTFVAKTKDLSYWHAGRTVGTYTYRIKAVDTAGNYSATETVASTLVALSNASAVQELTGTANQIAVSGAVGSVTLSLAGPFNLLSVTDHGLLVGRGASAMGMIAPPAGVGYVLASGAAGGNDPVWKTLTAGTGIDITTSGGSITITNTGGGGGGPGTVTSITGTPNQVIASASTGDVVLSLPQEIDTSAAVEFGTLFATGSHHGFGDASGISLMAGYTVYVDIHAGSTNLGCLQLFNHATTVNSALGDLVFGTQGTAAADQRAAMVRGALDQASGTNVYGRLELWTNTNTSWVRGLYVGASGLVVIGSLQMPSTATAGDLFYASSANVMGKLTAGANNTVLMAQGAGLAPIWRGGTNGQLLIGNGTGFTRATLTAGAGVSITNGAGSITITATGGGGIAGVSSVTGTANQVTAAPTTGAVVLSLPQDLDVGTDLQVGTLKVYGTANNQVLITGKRFTDTVPTGSFVNFTNAAGGTLFAVDITGAVTSGTWSATAVGATKGGTGQTTYTVGDILYANTTTTLAKLGIGTADYVLTAHGAGAAPTWEAGVPASVPDDLTLGTTFGTGRLSLISDWAHSAIRIYASQGADILFLSSRGTYASPTATQNGDSLGSLTFEGYFTSGGTGYGDHDITGAAIGATATQTWTATANGANLTFYVVPNNTAVSAVALTLNQDKSAVFTGAVSGTSLKSGSLTIPTTAVQGDVFIATAANTMGRLADVAVGSYFRSGGVGANPVWSTLILPNAATQGDVVVATGANTWGAVAAVAVGRVLVSGGASTIPAWSPSPYLSTGITVGVTGGVALGAGQFKSDSNTSQNVSILLSNAAAAIYGPLVALRHARGSIGSETATQSGDFLGILDFRGFGSTVWNTVGAWITAQATEAHTDTAAGTSLNFYVIADTTVSRTLALKLDQDGTITTGTWKATAIDATHGGTGQTVYAVGDLLYANTTTSLARLADVAAGSYLRSGGVGANPVWSTITLPNAVTTGDLLMATGSNVVGVRADVAIGSVLTSGGVGVAPAWASTVYLAGKLGVGETAAAAPAGIGQSTIEVNGGASMATVDFVTSNVALNGIPGLIAFSTTGTAHTDARVADIYAMMNDDNTATPSGCLRFRTADHGTVTEKFRIGHTTVPTTTGNWIELLGGTANFLSWSTVGLAAPGDGSVGTKLQLYGTFGTINSSNNYNIGVENSFIWNAVPVLSGWKLYQYNALVGGPVLTHRMAGNPYWSGPVTSTNGDILTSGRPLGIYTFATLPCFRNQIFADTPAMYLRMSDASPGPMLDQTANNNDATVNGTVTYQQTGGVAHDSDTCLLFDGSTGYLTVATSATMPTGDSFSLEFAFKRTATQSAIQYLVCQKTNGFGVFLDATNHLAVSKFGVGTIVISTTTYTSTTLWYYVQVVKDAANSCRIIVNGVEVSDVVFDRTIAPADGALWIGSDSATNQKFPGYIDEVSLWGSVEPNLQLWEHYSEFGCSKLGRVAYVSDGINKTPLAGGGNGCIAFYTRMGPALNSNSGYGWGGIPSLLSSTGITYTIGDLFYADGVGSINRLADVATGAVLVSGGVGAAPAWDSSPTITTMKVGSLNIATSSAVGDIFYSSVANTMSVLADVAVGRVLVSGGVGVVPAYSATPTLGVAGTTQGSLTLSGVTAGTVTLAVPANVTASYSLTVPAAAPAQGSLLYFSNATGTLAGLADVAVGQVLTSGGVNTVPAFSATPSLTSITLAGQSIGTINAPAGGTPQTPNLSLGRIQVFAHTAAMTINAPTNATSGSIWFMRISNTGASAWSPSFNVAFKTGTIPATWIPAGKSVGLTFYYDGASHWLMGVGGLSSTGPTGGL